ncbi:MAG: N-acetyltransferase [Streptococcaceae bacterium]|jgi:predicted GNAT family acetyltransferase|nr:N-acetyltransferase [Streptococcaceae bacterium]
MNFIESDGRLLLVSDTKEDMGELAWLMQDDIMIIDHTYVYPNFRRQQLAEKLVAKGIEIARKNHWRVHPFCPFAASEFDKKQEYQDLYVSTEEMGWEDAD